MDGGPLYALQTELEQIYALAPAPDVTGFLLSDREQATALGGVAPDLDEAVLVLEEPGTMNLALFLDADVVEQLAGHDVRTDNLGAWLLAAEGVSHFVCLVRRAQLGWPVTQLELELQGEIYKFLMVGRLLATQGVRLHARALLRWLFYYPELRTSLDAQERWRYRLATRLARSYCRCLPPVCSEEARRRSLREFYRLAGAQKVQRIRSLTH